MAACELPVMRRFLVELYLPRRSEAEIAGELTRLREAVRRVARRGVRIRYVRSLFIPADETCFHLLEACASEAVEQVLREARIEHERLSEALDLESAPGAHPSRLDSSD